MADIGQNFVKSFDEFHQTGNQLDKSADYKAAEAASKETNEEDNDVNEESEVNLWEEVEDDFQSIYDTLERLAKNTTDKSWKSALNSLISDLNKVEVKMSNYDSKLGIVPLKESDDGEETNEASIQLDVIDTESKTLKRLLKKHKVKLKSLGKDGPYSMTSVELTGKREDLIAVISSESGWDDPDLEDLIKD